MSEFEGRTTLLKCNMQRTWSYNRLLVAAQKVISQQWVSNDVTEREEFEGSVLCNRYSMWNGISDPEIGKFSLWFCESPPRLLGEHSVGYIETDGGSTVSSQGLEGGEVVNYAFCWLKMPLASYPGSPSQILSHNFSGGNVMIKTAPPPELSFM